MRLDPTLDVTTLPNPAERTIAKAMQDYGIILTDTSGAIVTQAEDDRPYMAAHQTTTNPYTAIFDGTPLLQRAQGYPARTTPGAAAKLRGDISSVSQVLARRRGHLRVARAGTRFR